MEICIISHESRPWEGVYSIHPCLGEEKKKTTNRWIILFTAVFNMTLSYITSAVIHLDTGGHAECTPTHTH